MDQGNDEQRFGLIKSFDIDGDELDGQRPKDCFVLGYELGSIDELLKLPAAISKPVHSANSERIAKSCHDAGRRFKLTFMPNDRSEEWMQLEVAQR